MSHAKIYVLIYYKKTTTKTTVQEQLNRINSETVSAAQANKENEGRLDFDTTVAIADSNKKLKSKLTSSGSKAGRLFINKLIFLVCILINYFAGIKIRGQASRIVSSFKTQSIVCSLVRDFSGIHLDGRRHFLISCKKI